MKLNKLHLDRFRGFQNLYLTFPQDAPYIVFIGENGAGKTSIMEGLSMMLRELLFKSKHHQYKAVDFNNPDNVNINHEQGNISMGVVVGKKDFEFTQQIMIERIGVYSEKDLIEYEGNSEMQMLIYGILCNRSTKNRNHEKVIEYGDKFIGIYQKFSSDDDERIAYIYDNIGSSYYALLQYVKALEYCEKAVQLYEKNIGNNGIKTLRMYIIIGAVNIGLLRFQEAIYSLEKVLAFESGIFGIDMFVVYKLLSIAYFQIGKTDKVIECHTKQNEIKEKYNIPKDSNNIPYISSLYLYNDHKSLQDFNDYLEVWTPVVLHYTASQGGVGEYKDALPLAFGIPMTTNFDMIADWFIEHENDENRKRLRVDATFRSIELELVRTVITKGLSYLNNKEEGYFSELQTEIDETVTDGQISSWLSIKKKDVRINVNLLSDGEKRVLVLLIDITRRMLTAAKLNKKTEVLQETGIVLIDELEQHLHPKWQRTLLPTLHKLFPNIQFVATTHSPQVLSYVPNGCAFSLDNGKAYPLNTYGRDNEWILETIMDDVARPIEVQKELDNYFDHIREGKLKEALTLREQIEKTIGADDPALLKADILIRKKQKSMERNEVHS